MEGIEPTILYSRVVSCLSND